MCLNRYMYKLFYFINFFKLCYFIIFFFFFKSASRKNITSIITSFDNKSLYIPCHGKQVRNVSGLLKFLALI